MVSAVILTPYPSALYCGAQTMALGACASGALITCHSSPCPLPAGDRPHESVRDSGSHIPAPSGLCTTHNLCQPRAYQRVCIAIGAGLSDWPGGSALLQPWYHVLNGLPYTRIMCVSRGVECGSHAAAPAALSIRRVAYCYPSWSRGCWMGSCRSSRPSGMHAIPARRRVCCKRFVPAHQRPRPALTAVAMMPPRRLEARATGNAYSLI